VGAHVNTPGVPKPPRRGLPWVVSHKAAPEFSFPFLRGGFTNERGSMSAEWLIIEAVDDDGTPAGVMPVRVHSRERCEQRVLPCVVHNPSQHKMVTWPLRWRGDRSTMERICPHGQGHPDPDHMGYVQSLTPENHTECPGPLKCQYPHLEYQGIHTCDGCCI
jgi:hypothetical protein